MQKYKVIFNKTTKNSISITKSIIPSLGYLITIFCVFTWSPFINRNT